MEQGKEPSKDVVPSGDHLSLAPRGALEHGLHQSCPSVRQRGAFVIPCHLVIAPVCGGQGDL